jgi:TonB family protein
MNNLMKSIMIAVLGVSVISQAAAAVSSPGWIKEAIAKVAAHRTTPRSAQLRGSKGIAEMEVEVDGRGMITDYKMTKSSGVPILDREADLIIMRVGSFGAPPGGAPTKIIVPIGW